MTVKANRGTRVLAVALLALANVRAQTPATFEVASVKANKSGANQVTINWQGGVTLINVPLRAIVQFAYNINTPSRLVGYPDWTNVERFDIQARAPEGMNGVEQMRPMLQALLADRFKLVAKLEKRELQSYALVKARADGKLGPNIKPAEKPCVGPRGEAPLGIQCVQGGAGGGARAIGIPIGQLAPMISLLVGRPVVDRTGLTGIYDLELKFSGDRVDGALPADPSAPSIFTALQEQLGLKLEAERELAEVLVIERIERATEN
ncbi:MAG TPA: TIGR03435 family protein [Vicinamibacterales bacterium]|nr:TIGR03435 family protein [Vicinamibacterales bacterium]